MGRAIDENIRKIQKSGKMYYITVPIDFMRQLKWQEHQKVVVKKRANYLVVKDWEKGKKK